MKTRCYNCGIYFDETSLGMKECFFHPGKFIHNDMIDKKGEFKPLHFDCCGATYNEQDTNHYEISTPKGCHKIDHMSVDDFLNLKSNFFRLISLKNAKNLPIYQKLKYISEKEQSNDGYIIYNVNDIQFEKIKINFPLQFTKEINLRDCSKIVNSNLDSEFNKIIPDFKNKRVVQVDSDNIKNMDQFRKIENYVSNYDNKNEHQKSEKNIVNLFDSNKFIPFCIILRVSSFIDQKKKTEYRTHLQCTIKK